MRTIKADVIFAPVHSQRAELKIVGIPRSNTYIENWQEYFNQIYTQNDWFPKDSVESVDGYTVETERPYVNLTCIDALNFQAEICNILNWCDENKLNINNS